NYVPKDGITITYRLRPLDTGYHPTNVEATGELTDNQNRTRDFDFPVPHVMVLQPFPMATPTEPPPTPTATNTPIVRTPPPTPTPPPRPPPPPPPPLTPPPTPTNPPTRVPQPIYLPILLKEECTPTVKLPDVVLVLDISTSMDRETQGGESKLQATINAA